MEIKEETRVVRYIEYDGKRLYEDGNGVQQDYDEAVKWYREAAAHGVNAAADRLKGLTGWRGLGKRGLKSLLS